jgi:hypothetical protein
MLHFSESILYILCVQLLPLSKTMYACNGPPAPVAKANVSAPPSLGDTSNEGDGEKASEDVEVNLSASLNDWLDKGLPSSQDLQVSNFSPFVIFVVLIVSHVLTVLFFVSLLFSSFSCVTNLSFFLSFFVGS